MFWDNNEYFSLTPEDIDIDARFLTIRKSKTAAGRRRVPIATKTLTFWMDLREIRKKPDSRPAKTKYRQFKNQLDATMTDLGLPVHLPHDTRHTTATLLYNAKVDSLIIKRILGHSVKDITEGTYTHLRDENLLNAIDRI